MPAVEDACREVTPGVFERKFQKMTIQLDCNTFNASFIKADNVRGGYGGLGHKTDDGRAAAAAPVLLSLADQAAPIEGGARIVATLEAALPAGAENVTCNIGWRMDSWAVPSLSWPAAVNGTRVHCGPMPSLPAEGPVDLFVSASGASSNRVLLHTFATFSASIGVTPYFNAPSGELLYKVNDTSQAVRPPYALSASLADGSKQLLSKAPAQGGDWKLALPLSFASLDEQCDLWLNITLSTASKDFHLQVRLLRVRAEPLPPPPSPLTTKVAVSSWAAFHFSRSLG